MATALSDALPLLNVDGTGRNNARSFRKGLLASLLLPQSGAPNPLACRPGVLVHDYDAAGVKSLRVDQTPTASGSVTLQPGAFVCERSNQGTYVGWLETSAGVPITPPTSDSTNPRYDVVYVQVQDKSAISTDATSGPIADVVTGTPSATPTVPAVTADGAVPIFHLYRPAGVPGQTITAANITDVRKSTGLVGTVRRLLPGDFLSDAGKVDGELRYRQAVGGLPSLVDYWDAGQGLWRGTQGFTLVGNWAAAGVSYSVSGYNVNYGTIFGLGNFPISVSVPDPGWPYRVSASTSFDVVNLNAGGTLYYYVGVNSVSNAQFSGSFGHVTAPQQNIAIVPVGNSIYTGPSTVQLQWDVNEPNPAGVQCHADTRNNLRVRIDPA